MPGTKQIVEDTYTAPDLPGWKLSTELIIPQKYKQKSNRWEVHNEKSRTDVKEYISKKIGSASISYLENKTLDPNASLENKRKDY